MSEFDDFDRMAQTTERVFLACTMYHAAPQKYVPGTGIFPSALGIRPPCATRISSDPRIAILILCGRKSEGVPLFLLGKKSAPSRPRRGFLSSCNACVSYSCRHTALGRRGRSAATTNTPARLTVKTQHPREDENTSKRATTKRPIRRKTLHRPTQPNHHRRQCPTFNQYSGVNPTTPPPMSLYLATFQVGRRVYCSFKRRTSPRQSIRASNYLDGAVEVEVLLDPADQIEHHVHVVSRKLVRGRRDRVCHQKLFEHAAVPALFDCFPAEEQEQEQE